MDWANPNYFLKIDHFLYTILQVDHFLTTFLQVNKSPTILAYFTNNNYI